MLAPLPGPCPKAHVLPEQRCVLQPGHAGHTASSEHCQHVAGSRPDLATRSTFTGKFLINKCPRTSPFSIRPASSQSNPSDLAFAGRQGPAYRKIPSSYKSGVHSAPRGADAGESRVGTGREHLQPETRSLQVQPDGSVPPSAKDPRKP